MARPVHPNKEIDAVIEQAESLGWTLHKAKGRGHAWGRLYCAQHDRDGCMISIWSTPRNAGNHARDLLKKISKCPHVEALEDERNDDAKS